MNHARIWIAPLLALSCNSPFWLGSDTGYASFRTEIWRRWPMAGTPMTFESAAEYDRLIELLVATRSVSDATKIYWDVRPSARYGTLEFRMADVCMTISEAVMVAGLIRGLAQRCHEMAVRNEVVKQPRPELLRAAKWRAARFGLDAELINVEQGRAKLAREVVEDMLDFIRPSLEENSEWDELSCLVRETLARGNGAMRQRRACQESGRLEDVVDFVIAETSSEIF